MKKIPRLYIIFGIVIIVFAIVIGTIFLARLASTGNRVNSEIAALKAKGDPTKLSDLAHPPIPDDENAAVVFNEIFKKYPVLNYQIEFSKSKTEPSIFVTEAKTKLAKYPGLIPLVEKALVRPDMDFKLDWNKGVDLEFEHYEKLRAISEILAAESIVNTIEGNQQRALHYIELNMKLVDMLKDEYKEGQLTRCFCVNVNDSAVKRYVSQLSVSEDTAKTLYDRLGELDFQKGLVNTVKGERVMGLSFIDGFIDKMKQEIKKKPEEKPRFFFINLDFSINKSYLLEKSNKYISLSCLPYYKFKNKWTKSNDENVPNICAFVFLFIPSEDLIVERDEMKARVGGTRIFIALHTYKHKYGKYPDSLDTLQNKLGWKIPQDPFNDKPYHYMQKGNGFVIYSIGKDLKDNNGVDQYTSYHNQKSFSDTEPDYDIVWKSDK